MAPPEDLPKMTYRFLGRSGLQISSVSLGGWLTYGGYTEQENSFECMKAAYDCGINFFDCAEEYSGGKSEIVMGQAIKKYGWKRNDLVISTKLYWGAAFGTNPVNNKGLSRKHIIEGMDASLSRLGLTYVDLVYAHRPDRHTPMEETVRAFNHLINTGKALYWGTSMWDADEIAQAWRWADKLGLIGPLMEQPQYNLLVREKVEREYAHLYRDVGTGLTVFSPLRQGLLSGKYNAGIPADSRFAQTSGATMKGLEEMVEQVRRLQPVADELGLKMSTLALAWVLRNENVTSAIIGASSPEQVYENVRAIAAVDLLTPAVMKRIDEVLGNKPEAVVMRF